MTLADCLQKYRDSVIKADSYLTSAFTKNPDGSYLYDNEHINFIVDAAFLKFYISWESFLESVFIAFIQGELTMEGTQIPKFVSPRDEKHACDLLIGTNTYFDWSNPELVRKLSKLFFEETNPINQNLLSISDSLFDLKTIRNAAAHISSTTQKKLDGVASKLLGHTQVGISVTSLITSIRPSEADTFWEYYVKLLDIVAENICKGTI